MLRRASKIGTGDQHPTPRVGEIRLRRKFASSSKLRMAATSRPSPRCAELLGRFNRAAEAVPPTQAIVADHSDASLALLGVFGDSQALAHA